MVYKSWISPSIERILSDGDVDVVNKVASEKTIRPQGMALPLLIYFVWRIFKWSKPERIQEEKIEQEIEEGIEKQRVQKKAIEKQRIDKERIGKMGIPN